MKRRLILVGVIGALLAPLALISLMPPLAHAEPSMSLSNFATIDSYVQAQMNDRNGL